MWTHRDRLTLFVLCVVKRSLTNIASCSADQCGVYPNDYTRFQTDWIRVYQTSYTPTIAPLPWFNVFGALAHAILSCYATIGT